MDWGGAKGGGDPIVGHYLFPPTGLMASETHLQQLKRHRQPESSPVDARRRRSPAFGMRPSCKTTPTYSSLLFFFSSLDYGVLHLCVSGPAYVYVVAYDPRRHQGMTLRRRWSRHLRASSPLDRQRRRIPSFTTPSEALFSPRHIS